MVAIRVYDILHKRALITRGSVEAIRQVLSRGEADTPLTLDFSGIDAMTPSFVDELLSLLDEFLSKEGQIIFLSPPTRLSAKFSAIARARGLKIIESGGNAWLIASSGGIDG